MAYGKLVRRRRSNQIKLPFLLLDVLKGHNLIPQLLLEGLLAAAIRLGCLLAIDLLLGLGFRVVSLGLRRFLVAH